MFLFSKSSYLELHGVRYPWQYARSTPTLMACVWRKLVCVQGSNPPCIAHVCVCVCVCVCMCVSEGGWERREREATLLTVFERISESEIERKMRG